MPNCAIDCGANENTNAIARNAIFATEDDTARWIKNESVAWVHARNRKAAKLSRPLTIG